MAASLDFTSVTTCSGGNHHQIGLSLNVNGTVRNRILSLDTESMLQPITDDDIETYVRLTLRVLRAQNPANLRQAILNKIVNLDA